MIITLLTYYTSVNSDAAGGARSELFIIYIDMIITIIIITTTSSNYSDYICVGMWFI